MSLKQGTGNEIGEWENEKLEQNRELEMKLLIGPRFKLGYVTISHFSGFSLRIQVEGDRCNVTGEYSRLNSHRLPNICPRILHS